MKNENKIFSFVLGFFALLFIFTVIQTTRLDSYREQLDAARAELQAADDRFGDIADTLARARESFSVSADTIAELRGQIAEVRTVFEKMEDYVNRGKLSCSWSHNDIGDYQIICPHCGFKSFENVDKENVICPICDHIMERMK